MRDWKETEQTKRINKEQMGTTKHNKERDNERKHKGLKKERWKKYWKKWRQWKTKLIEKIRHRNIGIKRGSIEIHTHL